MDQGPVTPERTGSASWELKADIAAKTQGLVVTGFGQLPTGRALFLQFPDGVKGAWLDALETVVPITAATPPPSSGDQTEAAAIAFSATGLGCMQMPETALPSFSRPFREGMFQEDRLRRLGDRRGAEWLETVIEGGPLWSANAQRREPATTIGPFDVPYGGDEEHVTTPLTVHAIVFLYTKNEEAADRLADQVALALQPHGVTVVRRLGLQLDVDEGGISREHFGFADGISQPRPYDEDGAVLPGARAAEKPDSAQRVPLGEFLIGYLNGHRERAPGPVVPGPDDAPASPDPKACGLEPHPKAQGFYDFGLNGSYVVVRELRQDVAAFWNSMHDSAKALRQQDLTLGDDITGEWVAEKVVGRNLDGDLLVPGGYLPCDQTGRPDTAHLYFESDPRGLGCPIGSHVRRANPRDSLAPNAKLAPSLLASSNNHRILRRGRKFGSNAADRRQDDKKERGLLFVCLNTDIARQFEFVQQTWILNTSFGVLKDEVDPLVGPDGRMTIPAEPFRRALHVRTFVNMAGGDYFFLPSLPALRYLAAL